MVKFADEFSIGSSVLWPNGTLGKVTAIDHAEDMLQDECGGWSKAYDCDLYIPKDIDQ
jgi:hypothetical protein